MLRRLFCAVSAAWAIASATAANGCTAVDVQIGMDSRGLPNPLWLDAIRDRVDASSLQRIGASQAPFTPVQMGWAKLVRDRASRLCSNVAPINAAFRSVRPPARVHVLLGTQAGDDAFTFGTNTIVLDLSAFEKAYGPSAGQDALVQRILSHEYTHLLIHPYLDRLGWTEEWTDRDPFLKAVRILFNEGIANLSSLQDPKWVANGKPTEFATASVAKLEPVLLRRLQVLERPPSAAATAQALRNISQGALTDKWGAIPIAVWLQEETYGSTAKLRRWIERGPDHILALAVRHARRDRRAEFERLFTALPRHIRARSAS